MRSPMINQIQKALHHNLPTILSAAAVAGVIGTVVLAVKATPHALADIEHANQEAGYVYEPGVPLQVSEEKAKEAFESFSAIDKVKACWRCYIPTAICGTATIACILGANAIGLRQHAALLGAYTLADTSFREYKEHVLEHITPQKAQKIDDEIMEAKIAKNPPNTETIIFAGGGDQLCYESLTGRYFKSDAETIRRAALDIDARILNDDLYASANEFFDLLGLDSCTIGAEMGWTVECRLKIVLSSHKTVNDQTALAVGYEKLPVYNYDKL